MRASLPEAIQLSKYNRAQKGIFLLRVAVVCTRLSRASFLIACVVVCAGRFYRPPPLSNIYTICHVPAYCIPHQVSGKEAAEEPAYHFVVVCLANLAVWIIIKSDYQINSLISPSEVVRLKNF